VQPYRAGAAFITLGKNSSSKCGEAAPSRTTTSLDHVHTALSSVEGGHKISAAADTLAS